MPIYIDGATPEAAYIYFAFFCGRPPSLVNSKTLLRNVNQVESQYLQSYVLSGNVCLQQRRNASFTNLHIII